MQKPSDFLLLKNLLLSKSRESFQTQNLSTNLNDQIFYIDKEDEDDDELKL